MRDPEDFDYVKVAGNPDPFSGEDSHGPWRVVGINKERNPETFFEWNVETVLVENIRNKQVADVWLRVYLERHVRDTYFNGYVMD